MPPFVQSAGYRWIEAESGYHIHLRGNDSSRGAYYAGLLLTDADTGKRVAECYQRATERPCGDRADFAARECGGDVQLRRDVESLLAHEGVPETRPPSTLIGSWIAPKRGNTGTAARLNKLVRIVSFQMAIEEIRKRHHGLA